MFNTYMRAKLPPTRIHLNPSSLSSGFPGFLSSEKSLIPKTAPVNAEGSRPSLVSIIIAKHADKMGVAIGQRLVERLVAASPAPNYAALVEHSNRGARLSAIPKLDRAIRLHPS